MAKLRHIALIVPDPEKAAKFFEEAFDMERAGKARRGLYVSDGTVNVALLKQEGDEKVGIYHFGMWVDDLDEAEKKVVSAGGKHLAGRPGALHPRTIGALLLRGQVQGSARHRVRPHSYRLDRRREGRGAGEELTRSSVRVVVAGLEPATHVSVFLAKRRWTPRVKPAGDGSTPETYSPTVIVAGAGPVGLSLSLALAQAGVRVCLVEALGADNFLEQVPRAGTNHPATLELFERIGLYQKLEPRGIVAPLFHYWDRRENELIAEFDHAHLRDDTRFPYVLQCERIDREALALAKAHPNIELRSPRHSRDSRKAPTV